ncbi:YbgA family protein [Nonomuraea sp. NPDC050643]|uniref:YbgA family protein n=1 Tax=Nonomuraea sp. NPDC050643 TaxID=3155660 RepID=UPI003406F961
MIKERPRVAVASRRSLPGALDPYVDPIPADAADADGYVGPAADARRIARDRPLLPVAEEGDLPEGFVERVFAHARLRTFLEGDWRVGDLVCFHARHKMQLLAHDPVRYRQAGRVVAGAAALPRAEVAAEYTEVFQATLAAEATVGRNVNALQHCLGMLDLDPARRADLVEVIESYQAGLAPLSVPATLLRHHARGEAASWVRDQTYLSPYPDDLRGPG